VDARAGGKTGQGGIVNQKYKSIPVTTGSIRKTEDGMWLVINRTKQGRVVSVKAYDSERGARIAMGRNFSGAVSPGK